MTGAPTLDAAHPDAGYVAVVTIGLDDDGAIAPLLELLVGEVEEWVCHQPGFISANYHVSLDQGTVLNYAQWTSEAAYKESFNASPRHGSLRDAILAIDGVATLSMTPYVLVRSVAGTAAP